MHHECTRPVGWSRKLAPMVILLGFSVVACTGEQNAATCSDGEDNDGDGWIDCGDPDCDAFCGDDDDDNGDCAAGDCDGDGWTVDDGDCDDQDPTVHPEASEACDGVDDDCDGWIDEDFDVDGDGYPDADNSECASHWPADQLDCDDADGSTYPGAHEECGDGADNDCDGEVDEVADSDGDGVTNCDGDCDDSDAGVYPGAPETCNDTDDDCDGSIDEGLPTDLYHPDVDGDGYGDPDGIPASDCGPPEGYAASADDCDDGDAMVNPGMDEVPCDGIDNDCDPVTIDEPDADGDGYTACDDCDDSDGSINPSGTEVVCDDADNDCDPSTTDRPDVDGDGYSMCDGPGGGDCDDGDPSINPGVAELPCDAQDNDCDAATPDDPDADGDGWGFCTDCDDSEPTAHPGMTEICNDGIDNDCNGVVDGLCGTVDLSTAHAKFIGEEADDSVGYSASTGDVDGDGDIDYLIGASYHDAGGYNAGAAYVILGPTSGTVDLSTAHAKLVGEEAGDYTGMAAAVAGDVNGDGRDDLIIGAQGYDGAELSQGAAYVVQGPVSGTQDLYSADARLVGEYYQDYAGSAVSGAGDVDGDGNDDLLVGAALWGSGWEETGAVYLVRGPVYGNVNLSNADAVILGESTGGMLGTSVASAGDVNGDGYDDLLAGAPYEYTLANYAGAAYVVLGPLSGELWAWNADAKLWGEATDDFAGFSVAGAGDVNGDGRDDVLVGAYRSGAGATYDGTAYLVHGPLSGDIDLANADAKFTAPVAADAVGWSVSAGGDVNGDGYGDLLIAAPQDDEGGSAAGAAYVVLGPASGTMSLSGADAKLVGEDANDYAGTWVSPAGDVNSDGFDDLLVGADGDDAGGSNAGAVYVVLGG